MWNTAIVIFADSANECSKHRRLLRDEHANLNLFKNLNRNTLRIAKETSVPYFVFDEESQQGRQYGQRIANAIKTVYSQGFENVVVISSDCPGLNVTLLDKAVVLLQEKPMVVGPAQSGGIYLVGISRSIFNERTFGGLHWESNLLRHDLVNYTSSPYVLPKLTVLTNRYRMILMEIHTAFARLANTVRNARLLKAISSCYNFIRIKQHSGPTSSATPSNLADQHF